MTTFLRRLKYYGIGFGVGMIFVFFFFQNRGCSWLPDNRVKNSILDRVLVMSSDEMFHFHKAMINNEDIIALLNDGDVDFKKSKTEGEMKIYFIKNDKHEAYFTLPNESFISEVRRTDVPVNKIKSTIKGKGQFLRFPNDNDLVYVDSMPKLGCQLQQIGMINQKLILKSLKMNGLIDFEKTNLSLSPKPEHYLLFNDVNKQQIGANVIWYKNKLTIQRFDLPFESNCD
jgi:hypothetical protein